MKASDAVKFLVNEIGISEKSAFEKNYIIEKFGDFEIVDNGKNQGVINAEFDLVVKNNTDNLGPKFRAFAIEMKAAKDSAFPRS